MGFSLFGVKFPDACPDVSNTACDRSSLTSIVMLTSLSAFGRGALTGLGTWMGRSDCHWVVLWVIGPLGWAAGCSPLDMWVCLQAGLYPLPVTWVAR